MARTAQPKQNAPARRNAPVRLTGASGTRYENTVAARFLLDMLAGSNSLGALVPWCLGADFGRVTRYRLASP